MTGHVTPAKAGLQQLATQRGTNRQCGAEADSCRLRAGFGPQFPFWDVGMAAAKKVLVVTWARICDTKESRQEKQKAERKLFG
jgi:hypothetical protein